MIKDAIITTSPTLKSCTSSTVSLTDCKVLVRCHCLALKIPEFADITLVRQCRRAAGFESFVCRYSVLADFRRYVHICRWELTSMTENRFPFLTYLNAKNSNRFLKISSSTLLWIHYITVMNWWSSSL